jgi:hypothetical protein
VRGLRSRHPSFPLILGGDWNMGQARLSRTMVRWTSSNPLVVMEYSGSHFTWHRGAKRSSIDHFVASSGIVAPSGGRMG